jgi:hypothetical protein
MGSDLEKVSKLMRFLIDERIIIGLLLATDTELQGSNRCVWVHRHFVNFKSRHLKPRHEANRSFSEIFAVKSLILPKKEIQNLKKILDELIQSF